jgi:diaminohydroxyphosphoribosylaminopyrimidine deaminase/5-amino-6-(5-phosphoribosylamino)uracil reductase
MNPANRNNGVRYLRKHGIKAEQGLLRFEADELNRAYNKFISTGMPFVTIKAAISLDGKIATKTGNSKWISSSQSRNLVKKMRREVDAVLVGRNTYLKDKPRFKGVKNKIYLGKQRANLKILMRDLAKKNIMHVLIEGGGETIASALEAGIADRICVFIAPIIIGGRNAPTLVEGEGIKYISNALDIKNVNLKSVGRDYMVTGCLRE